MRLCVVDVSDAEEVQRLKDLTYEDFGEVALLMNNAGIGGGAGVLGDLEKWRRVIDVNLWGVIHGVNIFAPAMIRQTAPSAIVNTGSKQGITCPPGDAAYNVSKVGVKVVTEALAHELRNIEGCPRQRASLDPGLHLHRAHGSRGEAAGRLDGGAGDRLLHRLHVGRRFLRPLPRQRSVTRAMDERRILWAAGDIVENRPPLSRWHPDYKNAFAEFAKGAAKP